MFWDTLRADIRHTLRLAIKTPVFTTLTILALALGIGATTRDLRRRQRRAAAVAAVSRRRRGW